MRLTRHTILRRQRLLRDLQDKAKVSLRNADKFSFDEGFYEGQCMGYSFGASILQELIDIMIEDEMESDIAI